MRCVIQWVDQDGKPTPDANDAVMMAHYHRPKWSLPCGGPGNQIIGYHEEIERSFPICEEHLARVTPDLRWPRGGWTFAPLETPASSTDNVGLSVGSQPARSAAE